MTIAKNKVANFKGIDFVLNQQNSQTISLAMNKAANNTRIVKPTVVTLSSSDILLESLAELQALHDIFEDKQIELYRQKIKQDNIVSKAGLDELLSFNPNFRGN